MKGRGDLSPSPFRLDESPVFPWRKALHVPIELGTAGSIADIRIQI